MRARFSPTDASKEISSRREPIFLDLAQITINATCPPDDSIQVSSSNASFWMIAHRLFSHEPQAAPWGKKLESQNVIIASPSNSID